MKILCILILILFIVKKNKPQVALIQFVVRLFASVFKWFKYINEMIISFWSSMLMEGSCAANPEDEKDIRSDYAHWLSIRKDYRKWCDNNECSRRDVDRIKGRNWACWDCSGDVSGFVAMPTVLTWTFMFIAFVGFLAA